MLVVKHTSIGLRLSVLSVAALLALVVAGRATAQDAPPTENSAERVESGAARPAPEAQDASEQDAAAASGVNPDNLPPIEITQPAVKEPGSGETAEEAEPRVAAVRPQRYRPTSYQGTGGSE